MATKKPAKAKPAKRKAAKSKAAKGKPAKGKPAKARPVKSAQAKEPALLKRNCGTMAVHMMLLEKYPSFRARQFQLEQDTAQRRSKVINLKKLKLATVKVVVNVVYKTPEQNITAAQISSQISALNRDFGATNPDKTGVPPPWAGLVTDSRIRFKLFKVQRKQTTKASFGQDDGVKKAATGGLAPLEYGEVSQSVGLPSGRGIAGLRPVSRAGRRPRTAWSSTTGRSAPRAPQRRRSTRGARPRTRSVTSSICGTSGAIPRTAAVRTSSPTRRTAPAPTSESPAFPMSAATTAPTATCS